MKSTSFEPKKAIGIGLRPSLWRRIDAFAEVQGKSRNQVIEEVLSLHVPVPGDSRKSQTDSQNGRIWEDIPDDE